LERLAHGTGSLFKITKISLLKAMQNGSTLERIIEPQKPAVGWMQFRVRRFWSPL
jgi:hypothetical protein